jgi:signal transduction histidine kinase
MEHQLIRILLIEDCAEDALLVRRELARENGHRPWFRLSHAGALQQALDHLAKGEVDVCLLDLNLPDSHGVDTVVRIREVESSVPIVVLTVAGDEETAVRALRAGAQDYLAKDEIGAGRVLRRAIHYAIERTRIIEAKRQLRERLLQAEKLESLGVLAAGAAFGFSNLLGTILEQLDAVLEHPADAERVRETLPEARATALRAAQLASELRDYVRSEPPTTAPVDLSDLVLHERRMIEAIAGRAVDVHYELDHALPRVPANAAELRHLLVNLVVNATEAVGGCGGTIRIATGSTWAGRELLAEAQGSAAAREGSYVYLRVQDSGPGMDARALERLFDPFFSTRFAGRGLGLSAAFAIVRRHGGVIHVGSPSRLGAAFTVLLPSPGVPS